MDTFIAQLKKKLVQDGIIHFSVKIIPKSQRSELVGMLGSDILKIRIAAAPEKNRANEALCSFLAEIFDVNAHTIGILSGSTSPRKLICIDIKNSVQ